MSQRAKATQRWLASPEAAQQGRGQTEATQQGPGLTEATPAAERLVLREAVADDEPGVRRCVEAAYSVYLTRMGHKPAPMLDDYERLIRDGVVTAATSVAETSEKTPRPAPRIIGLIVMWAVRSNATTRPGTLPGREPSEPDLHDYLYVDNLAVDPAAQGLGLGTALLQDAEQRAISLGLPEIRLYTNEAMTENLGFYERQGFCELGSARQAGYKRVYFSRAVQLGSVPQRVG